jgi:hypothetical protein
MKFIFTLILTFSSALSYAQPASWLWAKSLGGSIADNGISKTTDLAGNSFLTGQFNGTSDFDPGSGSFTLTASNSLSDIFIAKLDSSGDFQWAKQIGGIAADVATAITIAPVNGAIYITGYFGGTADFDPGNGVFNLISAGNQDAFILKLDSAGEFQWAIKLGSGGNDQGLSITAGSLATGNIYVAGKFNGTVDFNPDTAATNLTAIGTSDIFILKLDTAGNFNWARSFTGNGSSDELVLSIAITPDSSASIITTGYFSGTTDFDPGSNSFDLTAASRDIFLSKIDSSGDFIWAQQLGGSGQDQGNDIEIDPAGNIYTTGYFSATCDFDPGSNTFNLVSNGGTDIYIAKFDSNGNLIRANSMGGSGNDFGSYLTVNLTIAAEIYATGGFQATADFDPGPGIFSVSSAGGLDIFVLKTDTAHTLEWVERIGSSGSEYGLTISSTPSGIVTVNGVYASPSINFGATTLNNQSITNTDIFIARLETQLVTGVATSSTVLSQIIIFPNPSNGRITISNPGLKFQQLTITDLTGKVVYSERMNTIDTITADPGNLKAGLYMVTISSPEMQITKKLIIEN